MILEYYEMEIDIRNHEVNIAEAKELEKETIICKICAKSFSNKLSRNRHQLYCQKKYFAGQPKIRKSCMDCRRSKVKCNSGFPTCGRCQQKGRSCIYEKTAKSSSVSAEIETPLTDRIINNVESPPELCTSPPGLVPASESDSTPGFPFELDTSENRDFDNVLSSFPTSQLSSFDFTFLPDVVDFLLVDSTTSDSMFDGPYLCFRFNLQHNDSVPRMSTVTRRHSPFTPSIRPTAAIGHNFILQNIEVYPYLLLGELNLLPFIHSSSIATETGDHNALPSPDHLAICKNIVQMYQTRTPQTKGFIWRSIEAERLRFEEEYKIAIEWFTLSMLQATTIYILLRIFDPDPFTIDFDINLIQTMTSLSIKLEQSGFLCTAEVHGYRPQWREWILMESKRRIVIILFFICLLFEISPNQRGKALAGLFSLPLPATKALWEAKTEKEWEGLYDDMLLKRQGRRYLSYADLVFLGKIQNADGDPRMADLNGWFMSVDGIGVLVMMAATTF